MKLNCFDYSVRYFSSLANADSNGLTKQEEKKKKLGRWRRWDIICIFPETGSFKFSSLIWWSNCWNKLAFFPCAVNTLSQFMFTGTEGAFVPVWLRWWRPQPSYSLHFSIRYLPATADNLFLSSCSGSNSSVTFAIAEYTSVRHGRKKSSCPRKLLKCGLMVLKHRSFTLKLCKQLQGCTCQSSFSPTVLPSAIAAM